VVQRFVRGGLLACVAIATAWTALAVPSKDDLTITTSASTLVGVTPTTPGNAARNHVYAYCLPSGSSLTDSLPITFVLTNTNGTSPQTANVAFNVTGSFAPFVVAPASFSATDNGASHAKTILVNSGGAVPDGTYTANVQISATPANQVDVSHDKVQISVTVGGVCSGGAPACLLTDGEFNNLVDCSGNPVTTTSGGTFAILKNAKTTRLVATNPGQFYYNLFWTNTTGSAATVNVALTANNLLPKGANAAHVWTFPSGFSPNAAGFDVVNDGVPCGPNGPCTISVPNGHTLWATWHLEYAKTGLPSPPVILSAACASPTADGTVWARGEIRDAGTNTLLASCTATATGSLK